MKDLSIFSALEQDPVLWHHREASHRSVGAWLAGI